MQSMDGPGTISSIFQSNLSIVFVLLVFNASGVTEEKMIAKYTTYSRSALKFVYYG